MSRQPIVVGVDASPEAAAAAEFGSRMAQASGAPCQLVHAVADSWSAALIAANPDLATDFARRMSEAAHQQLDRVLRGRVASALLQNLIVEPGRPAETLAAQARKIQADLIVLGGKHHSALGRWFGGSTCHNVVRTSTIPVLVTKETVRVVRRVLVALDTSGAAAPTLAAALRLARGLRADVRAVAVIEPLPLLPESVPAMDPAPYEALWRETIETELRPLVTEARVELVIRTGSIVATIEEEADAWQADLLVVGSHGRNWTERLMLGSITERLLSHLPTSLVVVPVAVREPQTATAPASVLMPAIG